MCSSSWPTGLSVSLKVWHLASHSASHSSPLNHSVALNILLPIDPSSSPLVYPAIHHFLFTLWASQLSSESRVVMENCRWISRWWRDGTVSSLPMPPAILPFFVTLVIKKHTHKKKTKRRNIFNAGLEETFVWKKKKKLLPDYRFARMFFFHCPKPVNDNTGAGIGTR